MGNYPGPYEPEKEAKKAARNLGDFVNPYGVDKNAFIEEVCYRTHRTLQQSLGGLVIGLIKKWSEMYDQKIYDGRNEDICKVCSTIDKHMTKKEGKDWGYLPMV